MAQSAHDAIVPQGNGHASQTHEELAIGVILAATGAIVSNLGLVLQKRSHSIAGRQNQEGHQVGNDKTEETKESVIPGNRTPIPEGAEDPQSLVPQRQPKGCCTICTCDTYLADWRQALPPVYLDNNCCVLRWWIGFGFFVIGEVTIMMSVAFTDLSTANNVSNISLVSNALLGVRSVCSKKCNFSPTQNGHQNAICLLHRLA
jgi:hypothetical protein